MFKWLKKLLQGPLSVRPQCGHWTILAAKAWLNLKGHNVRIAHGKLKSGSFHCQAQANIENKWEWLEVRQPYVEIGYKDRGFIVEKTYTLEEFWEKWRNY